MSYAPKTYRAIGGDLFVVADGGAIVVQSGGILTVTAKTLTASSAITPGVPSVQLAHNSVAIAATIASAAGHTGIFVVKNTSTSGTAAHTLTLTSGTFNGTNTIATLNAPGKALVVHFDSAGNGTVITNSGSVVLS